MIRKNIFDKEGKTYFKVGILTILLGLFFLMLVVGFYSYNSDKKLGENKNIEENFIINNSDGLLIKDSNGVKTYYLGNGQFKDVIPLVSAQNPSEGELIDPYIYPLAMGTAYSGAGSFFGTLVIGSAGGFSGIGRGYMTFPLTNISSDSTIASAKLIYYVKSTSYTTSNSIEIRKIDEIVTGFSNKGNVSANITYGGSERSYGFTTGTNVSTTGWKNITLNSNFLSDIQSAVENSAAISVGINGSDESTNKITIEYDGQRPYIELTYTLGSQSAQSFNARYDGYVSSTGSVRDNDSETIVIGRPDGGNDQTGFFTFNTSSIPDSATIERVFLRLNITTLTGDTIPWVDEEFITFNSLNQTCVNGSTHASSTLAKGLYNNISNNPQYGFTMQGIGRGYNDVSLLFITNAAANDLQSMLPSDCFSLGTKGYDGGTLSSIDEGEVLTISSSEGGFAPQLSVIYSYTAGDCTSIPGSGDWTISTYCLANNFHGVVNGNLVVQNGGFLNMTGTTNISFAGSNRYIYIDSGGQINLYNTAGFNK